MKRKPLTRTALAEPERKMFSSGCTLLNCVLTGDGRYGYAENRIINIVGDKSTGKTLLAIEAAANFKQKYPQGRVRYCDFEAAFDPTHAEAMGLPSDSLYKRSKGPVTTVEEFNEVLEGFLKHTEVPQLVIGDSLDALSDDAEMARTMEAGTYGTKAKQMSQLFRRLNQRLSGSNVTVIIISQVRDNIGVTFGEKHTRSGGKALDFYASQVLWLSHTGILKKTKNGVERPYGVSVRAKCKKNKVGPPFRECDFPIYFNYGVEDVVAGVEFLGKVGETKRLFKDEEQAKAFIRTIGRLSPEDYAEERRQVSDAVSQVWVKIEQSFLPTRRKYGG